MRGLSWAALLAPGPLQPRSRLQVPRGEFPSLGDIPKAERKPLFTIFPGKSSPHPWAPLIPAALIRQETSVQHLLPLLLQPEHRRPDRARVRGEKPSPGSETEAALPFGLIQHRQRLPIVPRVTQSTARSEEGERDPACWPAARRSWNTWAPDVPSARGPLLT